MKVLGYAFGLSLAAVLAGCNTVSPIYAPTTGGYAGADISDKKTWTATGTLSNPAAAVDGDLSTAARSDYRQSQPELVIDLKRVCLFQMVIIEHGSDADGHAESVTAATSADGKVYLERQASPGTRRVTIISMPKPVLARYLFLKANSPGPRPWNVAEVYLQ